MSNDVISTRQLCFILAVFFPVSKLVLVPSALAGAAGNDLLLSALLLYAAQGAAVFALLWLMQRKQETLFVLVERRAGRGWARAWYLLLSLYFLFAACFPLLEEKLYVTNTMFDSRPSLIVFLPFFVFSTYAASKGLTSAGRSADLAVFFFVPAFAFLLAMAVGSADFTNLLPVGITPFPSILKGCAAVLSDFAEAAYLLVFIGHVRVERKFLLKTSLSYLTGAAAVLLFLAVFYGIFSTVAVRELYALSKIARYYNALKTIGRADLLFTALLEIVRLFALVLPVQLCVHTAAKGLQTEKRGILSLVVNALLLLFLFLAADRYLLVNRVVNGYLFPAFLLFAFLVPVLCPLFALKRRNHHER